MNQLTYQEQKIAVLIAQGLTNKEIAQRLGSSPFTVRKQVKIIMLKLELKNRVQVAYLLKPLEDAPGFHTRSLPEDALMRLWGSKKGANSVQTIVKPEGDPLPYVEEKLQPSTEREQGQRTPRKGDVYDRDREYYSRERLQATAPTLSNLLLKAIANPDDPLSPSAVRALGEFAKDAVKIRGISANSAAREFNVPQTLLRRWAKEGLIPLIAEGKGSGSATYLDREKVAEVVEVYHEAKQQNIQPIKLLQKMHPSKFEVPPPPK
jgi:DNA-binding CsgD family transcriptional regulator